MTRCHRPCASGCSASSANSSESAGTSRCGHYSLFRNEAIVLYPDGGLHSVQAWLLVQARGCTGARIPLYGLEEWKERILFPALPADAGPRQAGDLLAGGEAASGCVYPARSTASLPTVRRYM